MDPHSGHITQVTPQQRRVVAPVERHDTGRDGGDLWPLMAKHTKRSSVSAAAFCRGLQPQQREDVQTHGKVHRGLHRLASAVLQEEVRGGIKRIYGAFGVNR